MSEHSKLLPCPFCGQPAVTHEWENSGGQLHIECGNDDACPVTVDVRDSPAVAVAAWNTRSVNLLPELVKALEEIAALRPGVWMEAGISGDDCHKAPGIAAAALSKARAGASQS